MSQRTATLVLGCSAAILLLTGIAVILVGLFGASIFSFDPNPDALFVDVDRAVVEAAGYRVPKDATHIHLKDASLQDVRATWFRFDVPIEDATKLEAEYKRDEQRLTTTWGGAVPNRWPRFENLPGDFQTPEWWQPRKGAPAYQSQGPRRGAIVIFDGGQVHNLLWTHEGWSP